MDQHEIERVYRQCDRFLGHHYPCSPKQTLLDLAATVDDDALPDTYGAGELIESLEARIAELLGKEAAVFLPSGTMAQQIALRIWTTRSGIPTVAMHPRNHLDAFEHHAYEILHGMRGIRTGSPNRLLTLDDLKAIPEPIGALLLELPQRELGSILPDWDDLVAIAEWARSRAIPLHMDGARLWESQPFYGRSYAEICANFDSVYVSFYKTLGALSGAALAGPDDLIAEARLWQHRHGGRLIRAYPAVVSAALALDQRLDRMAAYHDKTIGIAVALRDHPDIEVTPDPPHTNMLHIYLRGDRDRLIDAAIATAADTGVFLTQRLGESPRPAWQKLELTVGDAALDLPDDTIRSLFDQWLARAKQP
ncbi:MAG TPA: beta-eliminating lyase-related protein [Thermomicrobiales bacterium]|nr:beta-eliminating lyase-related protein [Thermomicrobiales bacterium]